MNIAAKQTYAIYDLVTVGENVPHDTQSKIKAHTYNIADVRWTPYESLIQVVYLLDLNERRIQNLVKLSAVNYLTKKFYLRCLTGF